jgi:dihydrodipicolinate reductase
MIMDKIKVMIVGLKGELGRKTALEIMKNKDMELINFTLSESNGTIKVGEKVINLVPSKGHQMIIEETNPDIVVDFTSEFEDIFIDNLKLYIENNISFVIGTVFPYGDQLNLEELISNSGSSALIINNIYSSGADFLVELTIHAIKFLFNNQEKGQIFEDDVILNLE